MRAHSHRSPAPRPAARPRSRAWGLLDACFDLARLTPAGPPRTRLGLEPLESRDQPSGSDVIDIGSLLAGGLAGWQTFEGGGTAAGRGSTALSGGDLVLSEGKPFLVGLRR